MYRSSTYHTDSDSEDRREDWEHELEQMQELHSTAESALPLEPLPYLCACFHGNSILVMASAASPAAAMSGCISQQQQQQDDGAANECGIMLDTLQRQLLLINVRDLAIQR